MKKILCLLFLIAAISRSEQYPPRRLVRVILENEAQTRALAAMPLDFASRRLDRFADIVATPADEEMLRRKGYEIVVLETPAVLAKESAQLGDDMGAYHTYDEITRELGELAEEYPTITRLYDLGLTWEHRHIWAIKVSDHPEIEENGEPEVLYIGNIHAREVITPEVVMHFLNYLLSHYDSDPAIRNLVDTRQLWLAPMMNPDGHAQIEKGNRWWRKNRRPNADSTYGVDLNRNFSYRWGYDEIGSSTNTWSDLYRGPAPFSEPETRAIRDLVRTHHFVAAISYHSYGRLWLFSWSYIAANTPHHEVLLELARNMTAENGYLAGNAAMGTIYLVNGDTDDYFYGEQGEKNLILAFSPEVGEVFIPLETDIPKHLAETLPANLYLAQAAPLLADDPWRIFAPAIPAFSVSATDSDGQFLLHWTPQLQPPNTAVTFDVEQLIGYRQQIDHAESADTLWDLQRFVRDEGRGIGASYGYTSSIGNNLQASMRLRYPITPVAGQFFSFKIHYDLEDGYDYAYVRVSWDQGRSFVNIKGNISTNLNPRGKNKGFGITGTSNGWVDARFDLTAFAGKQILIEILYATDGMTAYEGLSVDDLSPVPGVDAVVPILTAGTDTLVTVQAPAAGEYLYRLRGRDADGQTSPWSALQPAVYRQIGDVDGDGSITDADVERCLDIVLGLGDPADPGEIIRANIDRSPEAGALAVNVLDLIKLVNLKNGMGRHE